MHKKLLFWAGIICTICGLIIVIVSLFDIKSSSVFKIGLGVINIFYGCVSLRLSRNIPTSDGKINEKI